MTIVINRSRTPPGEGFKIAALCALRDFGWTIEVRSRDWHLGVVTDTLDVDGRRLKTLAYEVRTGLRQAADTELTITPFHDTDTLETALLSFFYPDNPLLGEVIWSSPTAAVYHRSGPGVRSHIAHPRQVV